METLNIENFNPKVAELQALVQESQALTLPDPKDKAQVQKIHDARMKLRTARTSITKEGKVWREEALAFQRAVIAKEKELVALVEPEETRLEGLEAEAKRIQDREDRREFLPRRKERLEALADGVVISDDELLDMEGDAFEGYFNARSAKKNEADRMALAAKQAEITRQEAEIAQKKAIAEAEERGKAEATAKAERDAKEAEARKERERIAAEEAEAERKAKQEREAGYQAFLKEHGYDRETHYTTQDVMGMITLWKRVAIYTPPDNG